MKLSLGGIRGKIMLQNQGTKFIDFDMIIFFYFELGD